MEGKGDDPKWSKPTNHSPFLSTSMQYSMLILPLEVITKIFSSLPVKSLLRFRCLSKYWLSVISSPHFISTHLSLSLDKKEYTHHMLMCMVNPELILQSCTLESLFYQNFTQAFGLDYPMKPTDFHKMPKSDWILGSVNGLICLAADKYDLFIGNPSIRKYKILPDCRTGLTKFIDRVIHSFGYDEFHDDYKVVGIFYSYDSSDQAEVQIYSLQNDSWTSVDDCPSEKQLYDSGKFVNGKLHWVTTASGLDEYKGRKSIYSFDLADEEWEETVELPSYRGRDSALWLTVLGSDLSIFCNYEGTHLDVWVMKEFGVKESWTMLFAIKCPGEEVKFSQLYNPLPFMSRKGEIMVVFGSNAMIYNPKDESIRCSEVINFDDDYEVEVYVESLVSPFPTEEREDAMKNKRLKNLTSNHSPFPSISMQYSTLSTPTLPPELIIEIFSRLPVKSLLQFRCVSKYCLAEISSPQFINTHLSLSLNNKEYTHNMLFYILDPQLTLKSCTLESLFCQNVTEAFDLDYPVKRNDFYKKFPRSDWILGSVNGLICLAAGKYDLFVGNPSIRKYKTLPDARPRLRRKFIYSLIYSFGYDKFHDDYKVVGVFYSYDSSDQAEVKIYSLKNDSWTSVDDCPSEIQLNGSGKFVNGKLHWVTTAPGLDVYKNGNIYSFDLANEKWEKTVELPSYRGGDLVSALWLTVLGSDLSIFCNYEGTHIDVWVMKEYGVKESWRIKFSIKCPGEEVKFRYMYNPLFFMSKKGEIMVVFESTSMIYNPNDESIRYSEVISFDDDFEPEIYVESLVSPFSAEEHDDETKNKRLKNRRSRYSSGKKLEVKAAGKNN